MFFLSESEETPLSRAIINGDFETIEALKGQKDHLHAKNSLGFSALEIAHYLDKRDCLKILCPPIKRKIKVVAPNESKVRIFDQEGFRGFFQVEYISHLKFESYDLFKKVLRACPSMFRGEPNEVLKLKRNRRIWERGEETPESALVRGVLYHHEIEEGFFADVTIRWIDEVLEYGLFTNKNFKAGDLIGALIGEVRHAHLLRPGLNAYCLRYPSKLFSVILPAYYVVDGKDYGNEMRFVNHSYEPNLVPKLAAQHGLLHQLFFAACDIPKGTQLTWDYGEDYWSRRAPQVEI